MLVQPPLCVWNLRMAVRRFGMGVLNFGIYIRSLRMVAADVAGRVWMDGGVAGQPSGSWATAGRCTIL